MACGNWGMQAAVLASLILVFAQKFLRVFHFIQLVINSLCIIHWTRTEWTRTASWIQSYIFEFFHSFCPWNFSQLAWTVSAGFSWLRKRTLLPFSFFFFKFHLLQYRGFALRMRSKLGILYQSSINCVKLLLQRTSLY